MDVPRNARNLILDALVLDDSGSPVTGLAFDSVSLSVDSRKPTDNGWIAITLVAGTVGQYVANSWVEIGAGLYQFCPDNDLIVEGQAVKIRTTVTGVTDPIYGIINAVEDVTKQPGERTVYISVVDDEGALIPGAEVQVYDANGVPIVGKIERANTSGVAEFWLADDSYRARAGGLAGYYDGSKVAFTVDEEGEEFELILTRVSLIAPSTPGLCAVDVVIRHNGTLIEGASVIAYLITSGSLLDDQVASSANEVAVTDVNGRATLSLIHEDQFVTGDGIYRIKALHAGETILDVQTAIPSTAAATLEDILNKYIAGYGKGEGVGLAPTATV